MDTFKRRVGRVIERLRRLVDITLLPVAYRFSAVAMAPMAHRLVRMQGYHSQIGQDILLDRHVFAGKRDGVFVDVGAHDGRSMSNSLFFEERRGWSGVCIEPNPDVFAALQAARSVACRNVAVAERSGSAEFRVVTGYSEMLSGLDTTYSRRHRKRIESEVAQKGGSTRSIRVTTRRLDELLQELGIERVDLLAIDVEGAEVSVLRSLDLRRFGVKVVLVENNERSTRAARELIRQGYHLLIRIGWDDVYVPRSLDLAPPSVDS